MPDKQPVKVVSLEEFRKNAAKIMGESREGTVVEIENSGGEVIGVLGCGNAPVMEMGDSDILEPGELQRENLVADWLD